MATNGLPMFYESNESMGVYHLAENSGWSAMHNGKRITNLPERGA